MLRLAKGVAWQSAALHGTAYSARTAPSSLSSVDASLSLDRVMTSPAARAISCGHRLARSVQHTCVCYPAVVLSQCLVQCAFNLQFLSRFVKPCQSTLLKRAGLFLQHLWLRMMLPP